MKLNSFEKNNFQSNDQKSIEKATNEEELCLNKHYQSNNIDTIPYISMKRENLDIFRGSIRNIGDDYVFLFDIDDTLYKFTEQLYNNQIKSYHEAYEKLRKQHLDKNNDIPEVHVALKDNPLFGGTFKNYFNISPIQLEAFREQCDYNDFLERDDKLRNILIDLPFRKWAFTNGTRSRAEPILEILGMDDCFEGVICLDDELQEVIGKPMKEAFEFVENLLGIVNRSKVFFFDDNHHNIKTGNSIGWKSFHITKDIELVELIDDIIKDIKQ